MEEISERLSIRINDANENSHLWCNNGVWFMHYTVHTPNYQKERRRESLHTHNVLEARRLRDIRLQAFKVYRVTHISQTR